MENKKNLSNLSDEQIDGSTIKGGAGRQRPNPLGPPVDTTQHLAPGELPEGHLPDGSLPEGHGPSGPLDPHAGNPTPGPHNR